MIWKAQKLYTTKCSLADNLKSNCVLPPPMSTFCTLLTLKTDNTLTSGMGDRVRIEPKNCHCCC